eukprot:3145217-Pyramimonas_sp.AAC.1
MFTIPGPQRCALVPLALPIRKGNKPRKREREKERDRRERQRKRETRYHRASRRGWCPPGDTSRSARGNSPTPRQYSGR